MSSWPGVAGPPSASCSRLNSVFFFSISGHSFQTWSQRCYNIWPTHSKIGWPHRGSCHSLPSVMKMNLISLACLPSKIPLLYTVAKLLSSLKLGGPQWVSERTHSHAKPWTRPCCFRFTRLISTISSAPQDNVMSMLTELIQHWPGQAMGYPMALEQHLWLNLAHLPDR